MEEIVIGRKKIGKDNAPFIIAEMSGNHNHSLERALKIVQAVADVGADAVKLQTYTADTMTLDVNSDEFCIKDSNSLWKGENLHKLYQKAYTPWEWHKPIIEKCNELGLICFSTPFDESAVDFLETLNVPCYKIASFENNHIPLLKKVALTGKPVIISSGMASVAELDEAMKTLKKNGCNNIVLLKCTSSYPADPVDANILTIPHMRDLFDCQVGLSDHTLGIGVSVASVALGSTVIEKHFTLCRVDGGPDAGFSLEPQELKQLVIESKRAWQSLGKVDYNISKNEVASIKFRRSIYIAKDVEKGELLSPGNLKIVRPGYGLHPRYFDQLIGKKVSKNVEKGTPAGWGIVL